MMGSSSNNQKKKFVGGIHMHTDLSHDGHQTLKELADLLKGKGYDYIAITEHSHDVDLESMQKLRDEAERLSTDDFLIIAGLEFTCHHTIHIIGFGVIEPCESDQPAEVIDHIHRHSGVAILAHPAIKDYPLEKEWAAKLDCCEIWNASGEGKFLPQIESISTFDMIAVWNPGVKAIYGMDMHKGSNYHYAAALTYADRLSFDSLAAALKSGDFKNDGWIFKVDSSGKISTLYFSFIWTVRKLLNVARWARATVSG